MNEPIIGLNAVSYAITEAEHKRILLNNINYSFTLGTIYTISGPSGSGKTTLLYALAGLLDEVEGQIFFCGKELTKMSGAERDSFRLENISMIFQNLNLFSFMNVEDNILVPLYISGKKISAEIRKKVAEYLELMKLGPIQEKTIASLSGGEQQRVAIIRALINDPQAVLCDEPTASLDRENAEIFMRTLTEIKKQTGTTFILVTHDPAVFRFGEIKLHLTDGTLRAGSMANLQ